MVLFSELEGEDDEEDVQVNAHRGSSLSADDSPSCLRSFSRSHDLETNLPPT